MALNAQTFRTRTLTAVVFVIVMLGGLLWNAWSFLILFSIIHFGCWWEYLQLTEKIHKTVFHTYTKLGLMAMGYGLMLWFCGPVYKINGYGLKENLSLPVSAAGFALLLMGIFQKNKISVKAFLMALTGFIYISLCWGLMLSMYEFSRDVRGIHNLWFFPILIIASIWINDTMAYIVGSFIGKTPLSKISPKKTWEGTVGGIILAGVIGLLVPLLVKNFPIKPITGLIIALIAGFTGTLGDLFESKLKRTAGVKDSGTFMPGHGGFIDRFDSLLFATPLTFLYLVFFVAQPS